MKNIKNIYLITGALEALIAALWFVPSYLGVGSIQKNMLGEVTRVNIKNFSVFDCAEISSTAIASIIGVGISLILLIFPVIRGTYEKRHRMIYPKITAIYSAVLYIIIYISACSDARNYADIGGKASMKFGGVVFVILNIALLIQLFMISVKTKQLSKQTVQNAESNPSEFIQNVQESI